MATSQASKVIQHLRRAVLLRNGAGPTDGQLLRDFVNRRDEAALTALVQRHAPMVWGVCRRILSNHHDAEDAFQATFLVLVRKAASVASPELLANWLYGVAHHYPPRTPHVHQPRARRRPHAGGRTLAEVRVAAGYTNVAVTSAYLHVLVNDDEAIGKLFDYQ